ncbi:VWA domain-containing protein [Amycolatopsis sp. NPDC051061]|uniref:vWA domain-containing protein n=1 Tax=Amycolatopsis sp. NPDC051061 TaxID=3155042 RepID=UPI00341D4DDB
MSDRILPFYVVCDESYSMADHLDLLNDSLDDVYRIVRTDPALAGRARLGMIGFSREARIVAPLSQRAERIGKPGLQGGAETNFGAVFTTLRETIERDVERLRAESCSVYRPAVFFLSDGQPTDHADWPAAHARLVDRDWPARPRMIAFGIGDADRATMSQIGTYRAYLSRTGVTPRRVIREFAKTLASSLLLSGTAGDDLHVPAQVSGFTAVERTSV